MNDFAVALTELITEAKHAYTAAGLDCADGLLPPADKSDLDALAAALRMRLPPELLALYRIHGGQEYHRAGDTGLFGVHRLLTPAEAVEIHLMFAENCLRDPLPEFPPAGDDWGYWVPELIPFASWDAYDLCVHAESGEVWEFSPNFGLIRHRPSIAAVLREVIAEVQVGREPELGAMRGPD